MQFSKLFPRNAQPHISLLQLFEEARSFKLESLGSYQKAYVRREATSQERATMSSKQRQAREADQRMYSLLVNEGRVNEGS